MIKAPRTVADLAVTDTLLTEASKPVPYTDAQYQADLDRLDTVEFKNECFFSAMGELRAQQAKAGK